jgi:hypothetical protein
MRADGNIWLTQFGRTNRGAIALTRELKSAEDQLGLAERTQAGTANRPAAEAVVEQAARI